MGTSNEFKRGFLVLTGEWIVRTYVSSYLCSVHGTGTRRHGACSPDILSTCGLSVSCQENQLRLYGGCRVRSEFKRRTEQNGTCEKTGRAAQAERASARPSKDHERDRLPARASFCPCARPAFPASQGSPSRMNLRGCTRRTLRSFIFAGPATCTCTRPPTNLKSVSIRTSPKREPFANRVSPPSAVSLRKSRKEGAARLFG